MFSVTELRNPDLLVWLTWAQTLFLLVPGAAVWAWDTWQHREHSRVKHSDHSNHSHEEYQHAA